jgi:hypothetical protein
VKDIGKFKQVAKTKEVYKAIKLGNIWEMGSCVGR